MSDSDYSGERIKLGAHIRRAAADVIDTASANVDQLPARHQQAAVTAWTATVRHTHPPDWSGVRLALIGWALTRPAARLLGSFVARHPLADLADTILADANISTPDYDQQLADAFRSSTAPISWALMWATEDLLRHADPGTVSVMGIGYTPRPIVDFQLAATTAGLRLTEGVTGLDDPAVVIIDPAAGTGTYLVRAIERGTTWVADSQIARVYGDGYCHPAMIGCELMPWTHLLGELRIEHAYRQRTDRLDDPTDLRYQGLWLGDTLCSTTIDLPCGHTIFRATGDPAPARMI